MPMTNSYRKTIKATQVAQKTLPLGRADTLASKSNMLSMDVAKRYIALNLIGSYTEQDTREHLPHHLLTPLLPSFAYVFGAASMPSVTDSFFESKNVSELVAVIRPNAVIFWECKVQVLGHPVGGYPARR